MSGEPRVRHFQEWWRAKFGFVPHGDRVVCTLCHKSIVTRTSSVRRHFNTKHGPLIPASNRAEYIRLCVEAFENMGPGPELRLRQAAAPVAAPAASRLRRGRARETQRSPSPDAKICLKWNTYHNNIQSIFPTLLVNEQFVDVTLACEGRFIKCHKVILSACSPYFEDLLSQNPCQHPIILMKDIKFWEIRALVDFMYSGEANVAEEKLPSLLRAAEALQIKGLTSNPPQSAPQPNESGDSEDLPFEKAQRFSPLKNRKRKRKMSDSTVKSYESSQNDLPADKKQLKEASLAPNRQEGEGSHTLPIQGTSNHPPIICEPSTSQGPNDNSLETAKDAPQHCREVSGESSRESDSEHENYTFSMGKRPVADHTLNLRRLSRQEQDSLGKTDDR